MTSDHDPRELRAYAQRIANGYDSIGHHCPLADYILATVRDDDGEPVTREWLHSLGGIDTPSDMGPDYSPHVMMPGGLNVWDFNGQYWVLNRLDSYELRTRGQFRALCRGLGIVIE